MAGPDVSVEMIASDEDKLQAQYAVLGLYQVGTEIAQGNKFYQLDAKIYVRDVKLGTLELRPFRKALHSTSNIHLSPPRSGYRNDTTTRPQKGRIPDPDDKRFVVTYEWDRTNIKSQDVFTVILDALSIAAEHNNTHVDAYIPAARSATGDTVMSTWNIGEEGSRLMSWGLLKKALFLVWEFVIIGREGEKPIFGGVYLGLEFKGKEIGAGRILKFETVGGEMGGGAVER